MEPLPDLTLAEYYSIISRRLTPTTVFANVIAMVWLFFAIKFYRVFTAAQQRAQNEKQS